MATFPKACTRQAAAIGEMPPDAHRLRALFAPTPGAEPDVDHKN